MLLTLKVGVEGRSEGWGTLCVCVSVCVCVGVIMFPLVQQATPPPHLPPPCLAEASANTGVPLGKFTGTKLEGPANPGLTTGSIPRPLTTSLLRFHSREGGGRGRGYDLTNGTRTGEDGR